MRALLFGLLLLAAGCVDLDRPRAFRCDNGGGCTGGWVCLKDHYCHDPDAGADVACDTKEDCTGGWFCGQERRCLDPRIPAPYPCADDTQCARPWRCSSEGRCVDLTTEPAALPFQTSTSLPTLESPLTDVGEQLRAAPLQYFPSGDGPVSSFQSAFMVGNDLEVAHLSGVDASWRTLFLTERSIAATLAEAPRDLAYAGWVPLVLMPSGALLLPLSPLPDGGAGIEVTLPPGVGAVERLVPLTWNEPDGSPAAAFMALTVDAEAILIAPWGAAERLPGKMLDVASTTAPDGGGVLLLFLREGDGGQLVTAWDGQPERLITELPRDDGGVDFPGRAVRLRAENGFLGVTFEKGGGLPQYTSALLCQGEVCELGAPQGCPDSPVAPPDFGLIQTDDGPTLRLACPDQGTDFIYDVTPAGLSYVEPRQALSSWGTSRGHVRQGFWGQLSYSSALGEELSDVLDGPPDAFGVAGHRLAAARGQSIYVESVLAGPDAGLPLGLSLFERIRPGVAARPAGFVEGEELTLLESGAVISTLDDGGLDLPYLLPSDPAAAGTIARMVSSPDGGRVLVVTTKDALHAGAEDPELTTLLPARLSPAPGYPINDWALRAADGGLLEGWAVANNRLFRVTASTVERWKSSEVPVTGRDPLGVWFSGEAVQLGTASGEVLSLPSRVRVVPPLLDGVTSMTGLCGAIFATTTEAVWEVSPVDAGLGEWLPVNLGPDVDGVYRPMLHRVAQRLFVIDDDGVVLELPVACP